MSGIFKDIQYISDDVRSKVVDNPEFDFFGFIQNAYRKALEMDDQLSFYINGLKGAGKTSLASIIIEGLGLPIYNELFIRTLPQFYTVNKIASKLFRMGYKVPYMVIDDAGGIADKWSSMSKLVKLINKLFDRDRILTPLVIITDTDALVKHIREGVNIQVDVFKIDAVWSEATLKSKVSYLKAIEYEGRRRGRRADSYGGGKWIPFATITYKHFMPDRLRQYIMESKQEEYESTLETLKEEIILRNLDPEFHKYLDENMVEQILQSLLKNIERNATPILTDGGEGDA